MRYRCLQNFDGSAGRTVAITSVLLQLKKVKPTAANQYDVLAYFINGYIDYLIAVHITLIQRN